MKAAELIHSFSLLCKVRDVVVKDACEKIQPLMLQRAFDEFFELGKREAGESVADFINRRETEQESDQFKPKSSWTSLK